MATYKNTNSDYIITLNNGLGNFSVTADSVTFTAAQTTLAGNLNVLGEITYVTQQSLTVDDPFITVAGNNTGNISTALFPSQGLVAQTSANTHAGLRFNNGSLQWEVSSSVEQSGEPIQPYQAIKSGPITNQVIITDGSTSSFTLAQSSTAAAVLVAVNRQVMTPGAEYDYTVAGNVITFNDSLITGSIIDIRFL